MVIVEIRRDYDGFAKVLGEHRWSEFLRDPSEEEVSKSTKVFYCRYTTGREVTKVGECQTPFPCIRCTPVNHSVSRLEGDSRQGILVRRMVAPKQVCSVSDMSSPFSCVYISRIVFPYPQTHYCDLPVEDKTNEPLCRPLPVQLLSAPKPPPVPGKLFNLGIYTRQRISPALSRGRL
jgi:hypothetical protein